MASARVSNPWGNDARVELAPDLWQRQSFGRSIDNTQTVRKLSLNELQDPEVEPWYGVQLLQSEHLVKPEDVPALDLFDVYSLYTVTDTQQQPPRHLLRIGFFSTVGAAQAVASYLQHYYAAAEVLRVSAEERARFAETQLKPHRPPATTGNRPVAR